MPDKWWESGAPAAKPAGSNWWEKAPVNAPPPGTAHPDPIPGDASSTPTSSLWDRLLTPLTSKISQTTNRWADQLNATATDDSWLSKLKGFGAGALQGAGNTVEGFTSPAGLAMTAGGLGAPAAAGRGMMSAAAALRAVEAAGSAVQAAHGVQTLSNAKDVPTAAIGALELAGGGLGAYGGARGLRALSSEAAGAANTAPRIPAGTTAGDYAASEVGGRTPYVAQEFPGVPYERKGSGPATQASKANIYSEGNELSGPNIDRAPTSRRVTRIDDPIPDRSPAPASSTNWWESPASPTGPVTHAGQLEGLDPTQVIRNMPARSGADVAQQTFFDEPPASTVPRWGRDEPMTASAANTEAAATAEPLNLGAPRNAADIVRQNLFSEQPAPRGAGNVPTASEARAASPQEPLDVGATRGAADIVRQNVFGESRAPRGTGAIQTADEARAAAASQEPFDAMGYGPRAERPLSEPFPPSPGPTNGALPKTPEPRQSAFEELRAELAKMGLVPREAPELNMGGNATSLDEPMPGPVHTALPNAPAPSDVSAMDELRAALVRGGVLPGENAGRAMPQKPNRFSSLDPKLQHGVRWINAEVDNLPFIERQWFESAGEPVGTVGENGAPFKEGAAGGSVFHEIMQGRSGSRPQVVSAIRRLMQGKKPTAVGERVLDLARRRMGIIPDNPDLPMARPEFPPEAGDPPPWDATSARYTPTQEDIDRFHIEPTRPRWQVDAEYAAKQAAQKADPEVPPHIAQQLTQLHSELEPKWQQSHQELSDRLGVGVDTDRMPPGGYHENIEDFARRVLTEADPRTLFGRERAIRKAYDAHQASADGEAGFIDPTAVMDAAKAAPGLFERLAYAGMLSGGGSQSANVVGGAGAVAGRGLEDMLSTALGGPHGNRGLRAIAEYFNPGKLASRVKEGFLTAPETTGKGLPSEGLLGTPGRVMHSFDYAGQEALQAAGHSPESAADVMLTGEPKSDIGKGVSEFHKKGGTLGRVLFPFVRTGTNQAERGFERIPGLGILASKLNDPDVHTADIAARQILGAGSSYAGYEYGKKNRKALPRMVATGMGAYGIPAQMFAALGAGMAKGQPTADTGVDMVRESMASTPLPVEAWQANRLLDPEEWAARPVPNALRDIGNLVPSLDSRIFDPHTKGVPYPLGKVIQKIPGLNAALLNKKPLPGAKSLRFSAFGPARYE